jgi:hypothetical protein
MEQTPVSAQCGAIGRGSLASALGERMGCRRGQIFGRPGYFF